MKKIFNIIVFLLAFWMVLGSYYAQYQWGFVPCALCLMQRWMAIGILFATLIDFLLSKWFQGRLFNLLESFAAAAGVFFASRQLWLMSLPQNTPAVCMPGLEAVVEYLSWPTLCKALFWGTSDCGHVAPKCLGLSMPMWSLIVFGVMLLMSLIQIRMVNRPK